MTPNSNAPIVHKAIGDDGTEKPIDLKGKPLVHEAPEPVSSLAPARIYHGQPISEVFDAIQEESERRRKAAPPKQ
jgi:hypothetical protein